MLSDPAATLRVAGPGAVREYVYASDGDSKKPLPLLGGGPILFGSRFA